MQPEVSIDQLKDALRQHAEQIYLPSWFTGADKVERLGACGTTLCVAGFACLLAGDVLEESAPGVGATAVTRQGARFEIADRARQLLGMTSPGQWGTDMFYPRVWPPHLWDALKEGRTPHALAETVCRAVDYYYALDQEKARGAVEAVNV